MDDKTIRKAKADAARAEAILEEERFKGLLEDFAHLFGPELPLFIPCVRGDKMPLKGVTWTKYTQQSIKEDTEAARHYWKQFNVAVASGGNLAIKLGRESQHLLAIDYDNDDLVEPFLDFNSEFAGTLCTRGNRGCQFWFYSTGPYPTGVFKIEIPGVEKTGEFRGGNQLSIVWGKNRDGDDYQRLNDVPPIRFDYRQIKLPPGWKLVEIKTERKTRIDWPRFNEMVNDGDGGIVEALVGRYWSEAMLKEDGWRCANIGGDKRRGRGSFRITPKGGWCQDFDGSFDNTGIIDTLLSPQRAAATGQTLTIEEIFEAIKEDTGEDFILTPAYQLEKDLAFLSSRFAYSTDNDEFYFDHGATWGAVTDSRADLILSQDLGIYGDEKAATLARYKRFIMKQCQVSVAVNVAGYRAGIHKNTVGKPFLVVETTATPAPLKGEWRLVKRVLGGMLGTVQICYFHCWMKWAIEALRDRTFAPGHYLIIVGLPGCGKTLTQEKIISPLLGCGPTNATSFLTGATDFNQDLMGAFHWMISDGLSFKDYQGRKSYTENVKRHIANSEQRLHVKFKNAGMIPFNCRLSNTLNPKAIGSLPLFEEGMIDKLLVLVGQSHRHLPSASFPRADFEAQIQKELPAYAYFLLNEWKIPNPIRETNGERFGFHGWINPSVIEAQSEVAREVTLAEIIRKVYAAGSPYEETIGDHHERLSNPKLSTSRRYLDLCRNTQALGHLFNDLVEATDRGTPVLGVEVARRRSSGLRLVKILVLKDNNLAIPMAEIKVKNEKIDGQKLAEIRARLRKV